jgi:hypothetical protein
MTDVLSLNAVRAAVTNVRREAVEIIELCNLAGRPALAAEFVRDGLNVASAQRRLEGLSVAQPVKPPAVRNGGFDAAAIHAALRAGKPH